MILVNLLRDVTILAAKLERGRRPSDLCELEQPRDAMNDDSPSNCAESCPSSRYVSCSSLLEKLCYIFLPIDSYPFSGMNDSAVSRVPVEIWEHILDLAVSEFVYSELKLTMLKLSSLSITSQSAEAFKSHMKSLRIVCKSWKKYISAHYPTSFGLVLGSTTFRVFDIIRSPVFVVEERNMTVCASISDIIARPGLIRYDGATLMRGRRMEDIDFGSVITSLSNCFQLRYLCLTNGYHCIPPNNPRPLRFPSLSVLSVVAMGSNTDVTSGSISSMARHLELIVAPNLEELLLTIPSPRSQYSPSITKLVTAHGRNLKGFSLVCVHRPGDSRNQWRVGYLATTFWALMPKLEYFRQSSHSFTISPPLSRYGDPSYLPPNLTTFICHFVDTPDTCGTLDRNLLSWLQDKPLDAQIQTYRLECRWSDRRTFRGKAKPGGGVTLAADVAFSCQKRYNLKIRLEDISGQSLEDWAKETGHELVGASCSTTENEV